MKITYKNKKGKIREYKIDETNKKRIFGNKKENSKNVGFRVEVENRDNEIRSFRYDRIMQIV